MYLCVILITLIEFVDKVGFRKVVDIVPCRVGAQSKKPLSVRKQVWLGPCMVRASHRVHEIGQVVNYNLSLCITLITLIEFIDKV